MNQRQRNDLDRHIHAEYMSEEESMREDDLLPLFDTDGTHFQEEPPQEPETARCYLCVRVEYRMDEAAAKEAGHEWPERKVIEKKVVNQRFDATEVVKLDCGHWLI